LKWREGLVDQFIILFLASAVNGAAQWNIFCGFASLTLAMEKPLERLSASKLRTLLIEEVRSFVELLDAATVDELAEKRSRLCYIFKLLGEREKLEALPIIWGKGSPKTSG
jgi:hypothetical protein